MLRRCLAVLLGLLLALPAFAQDGDENRLRAFARQMRLVDQDGFVETVKRLRSTRRLPDRYMTKAEAERAGWRPGSDLCRSAPGRTIGGDRFGNFERRLPSAQGRSWREADLDFNCGRRGAKRLVFSSDGLIYVTIDHYESFREVPR
ncbi:MAG: ribonuclease [Alphaproteobacteria bacterium]|nr:ribonuclease [Alphaproteobacteria bacterium]